MGKRDMPRASLSLPFNGRLLRRWREVAGLQQQQLADACGLSRAQISSWETGASKPPAGALHTLVAGLTDVLASTQPPRTFTLEDLLDTAPARVEHVSQRGHDNG
jgi:transcriptional regulator with XRE-family HTH domain